MTLAPSVETQTSALSENPASRDKPKNPRTVDYAAASWHGGYLPAFFVSHGDELHAVIQEAADWIESQQASLQESDDFKARTILQKAA